MALACRVDSCFAVPVGFADADAPDDRATSPRERFDDRHQLQREQHGGAD